MDTRALFVCMILTAMICALPMCAAAEPTPRPTATATLAVPDTESYETVLGLINFDGSVDNLDEIRQTLETPYTNVLGTALFYVLLFGVPAVLIWFATGSAKIPAIIGVIFSGFCVAFLPDAWGANIFILIVTVITTGIMWIFISRSER